MVRTTRAANGATMAAWRRLCDGTLQVKFHRRFRHGAVVLTTLSSAGRPRRPKRMKIVQTLRGYWKVGIWHDGRNHSVLLHRLAWMAKWNMPLEVDDEVDHGDCDRGNCHPSNLARLSKAQNLAVRNFRQGFGTEPDQFGDEEQCAAYYAELLP